MLGGLFLCYEGFEKVAHKLLHSKAEDAAHHADHLRLRGALPPGEEPVEPASPEAPPRWSPYAWPAIAR